VKGVELLKAIQWGTVVYQLAIFVVLLMLLRKYALKPLLGILVDRQEKIANDIALAEKNRLEAQEFLKEQQKALEAARKDATKIIENARATSDKQADEIIRTTKAEIDQFKKVARDEINREKEQAVEALREQVGALSVMLASKVIEKELDAAQQEKLVKDYLNQVGNFNE
jgi:F-type H+-transporting ATPase subunit b